MQFFSKLFFGEHEKLKKENEHLLSTIKSLKNELLEKENIIVASLALKNDSLPSNDYSEQRESTKKELETLKNENAELKDKIEYLNKFIPSKHWKYSYHIKLQDFYTSSKYSEMIKHLNNLDISYVHQLDESLFLRELKDFKYLEEALQKYLKFKSEVYDWNTKTILLKGEKISKVYSKFRKFISITSSYNLEYMVDLEDFDFKVLAAHDFSRKDINLLINIYKNYK